MSPTVDRRLALGVFFHFWIQLIVSEEKPEVSEYDLSK